jgi:hypothetical protein
MAGNTNAIADGIVTLLQTLQYQSANLYNLVKKGSMQDPTDNLNYAAVTFAEGLAKHYASGGKIDDQPIFQIESGFPYTDATAAETLLLNARDIVLNLFLSRVYLGSVPGVYLALVGEQSDRGQYKVYPNGNIYRVHQAYVKAFQMYNVTIDR